MYSPQRTQRSRRFRNNSFPVFSATSRRAWCLVGFFLLAAWVVVVANPQAIHAALPDKPNIIYIMVDDLGYGDLGCYGQKRIRTPHIDRLAAEGMKLTSYYAGNTVCRPSRLVLWTGMHAGHTKIDSNAGFTMSESDTTVAELLKGVGYATGGVGKWACGTPGSGGEPIHHGFDFWMGYLDQGQAHNFYPTHLWRCVEDKIEKVTLPGNVLMDDPKARGRVAKLDHRVTYSHDVMSEEALGFIRAHHDKPFLLHVHWTIPHTNNEGGRVTGDGQEVPDYGIYANEDWPNVEKGFAAMITRMDGDVGRIVALLREKKIDQRTLIIFTADNGPHHEGGHDHKYFDSNGPLRGYKRDLYEGGIRVPTLAWWPGVIEPGTTSDEPLAFYDFLPTACDLANVKAPSNTDGVSFVPTLLGKPAEQTHHAYLFWKFGNKATAVRMGQWKLVQFNEKEVELYDLSSDIGEQKNIADKHANIVKKMQGMIAEATKK